jgi:hypothetical protein
MMGVDAPKGVPVGPSKINLFCTLIDARTSVFATWLRDEASKMN